VGEPDGEHLCPKERPLDGATEQAYGRAKPRTFDMAEPYVSVLSQFMALLHMIPEPHALRLGLETIDLSLPSLVRSNRLKQVTSSTTATRFFCSAASRLAAPT
jgi:hypothetical protein